MMFKDMAKKDMEDLLDHSKLHSAEIDVNWEKGTATTVLTFDLTPEQIKNRKLGVDKDA